MRTSSIEKCEPATAIIAALGGLSVVAKATGVSAVTAQRWRFPVSNGGTGGFIPRKHHSRLIDLARERGIELSLAAFVDASQLPDLPPATSDDQGNKDVEQPEGRAA